MTRAGSVSRFTYAAALAGETQHYGRYEIGRFESAERVTNPTRFPTSFKEAPELAALVRAGKLPPVAERIGQDPIVLKPLHRIGTYGGTLHRAFRSDTRVAPDEQMFVSGPDSLLWWDNFTQSGWEKVIPNIARDFELSDDETVVTVFLRRGMRWSDGAPFTSEDIMFWYEDMYLNRQLIPEPHSRMQLFGEPIIIETVDRYTVRYVSPGPNPLFPTTLSMHAAMAGHACELGGADGMGGFAPKHYLSRFHPQYADGGRAAVDEMVADAGFPDWPTFFKARNDWTQNADLPVLCPWIVVKGKEKFTQNFVLERNPYSIWVDTDGNQLPYIGRLDMAPAESSEDINARAAAGEYDFQDNYLWSSHLAHLKDNEEQGGYRLHLSPEAANIACIRVNTAYEADPVIGDLLRLADFRRALSLGVDREEISEVFFEGLVPACTIVVREGNRYDPGPDYRTRWATLDVEKANQMLDALGLDHKDAEGFRLRPDGKRLQLEFTCHAGNMDNPGVARLIMKQWTRIGVDATLFEPTDIASAADRPNRNLVQLTVFGIGGEDPFVYPDELFPSAEFGYQGTFGVPFIRWFLTDGKEGKEPPATMREVMALWRKGYVAPEAERIEIGKQMYRILIDEVYGIGLFGVGIANYGAYIAKTTLGNIPASVPNYGAGPGTMHPMTFYFT
jgi:peptide/nickel transport system substrate-binding protein